MFGQHERLGARWFSAAVQPEYLGFVLVLVVTISFISARKSGETAPEALTKAKSVDKKIRKFGEWTPISFVYPPVKASPQEPAEMRPIPYRPFRAGEYHVTMGIRSMNWDEWIELDDEYEKYHRIRQHRIRTRGAGVIRVLPENPGVVGSGADAAIETVHELAEYLSRRFPTTFSIERHSPEKAALYRGWDDLPPVKSIRILPLDESYELPLHVNDGEDAPARALEIAAFLVQEDLAIMIEDSEVLITTIYLQPPDQDKLQMSMERFFQRLSVDKPVARNNYFFQVVKPASADGMEDIDPEELGWAESSHGPEDSFSHTHPADQPTRPTPTASTVRLRSERQTLRRLPRTGAILFTIRTYLTPIDKLAEEPGVARRLAGALRGWGDDIGEYKGKHGGGWWDVVLDYLDKKGREEESGGDDIKRMDNYPF
ncbi:hypothetical protein H0H92_015714 [Tricholoma furcatifolium]|nr:hypothetical protein H0H92_015714 [Tricholoma furcatifolium]